MGEVGNAEQSNINWGRLAQPLEGASARPSVVLVMNPDLTTRTVVVMKVTSGESSRLTPTVARVYPPSQQGKRQAHRSSPSYWQKR